MNYYNSVLKVMGGAAKVNDSYRLFMAPGMNHCGGGDGPSQIDPAAALDAWVAGGKERRPDQLLPRHSTGNQVDRSRPLCPYPQVAKYQGTGSIDEASS